MPQIFQRYIKDMPNKYLRYAKCMPKICQRYTKDMPKICKRYTKDMPKICKIYAKYMPKICQRYAKDMPKICQRLSFVVIITGVFLGVLSLQGRHSTTYNEHLPMNELHTVMQPAGPRKAPMTDPHKRVQTHPIHFASGLFWMLVSA